MWSACASSSCAAQLPSYGVLLVRSPSCRAFIGGLLVGAAPGPEAVRWFANETALDAARRFAAVHGVATAPECGVACAVGRLEAVMLRDVDRRPSVTANNCETYTECMSAARARAL